MITEILSNTKELLLTPGGADNKHIMTSKSYIDYRSMADESMKDDKQLIYFVIKDSAVIEHDEHAKVVLSKGKYVKSNQVEFNPFDNSVSYVFD